MEYEEQRTPVIRIGYSLSEIQIDELKVLQDEQAELQRRLLELQEAVDASRKEFSILKLKATISLGNMKLEVDSLEEDKQCLLEKCDGLERKLFSLQMEQLSRKRKTEALENQIHNNKTNFPRTTS